MRSTQSSPRSARWDEVNGQRVRCVEAGAGGEPVVIVPGLGALGYLLDTVDRCGERAHTFLLDVPGFGHHPPRPCRPEPADIGRLVAAWLSSVPHAPAVLVGHSTGAQAALHAAVAAPERVRALVLIGPTMPPELRGMPALLRAFLRNSRHEPAGQIPVTWPYYLRGGPKAMLHYIRSAQRDTPEDLIARVTCPVLLARGRHDAFAPQGWLDQLAAAAPHARMVTAPGAHAFPYQHATRAAALIAEASASSD